MENFGFWCSYAEEMIGVGFETLDSSCTVKVKVFNDQPCFVDGLQAERGRSHREEVELLTSPQFDSSLLFL